jgi:hypothetical protein
MNLFYCFQSDKCFWFLESRGEMGVGFASQPVEVSKVELQWTRKARVCGRPLSKEFNMDHLPLLIVCIVLLVLAIAVVLGFIAHDEKVRKLLFNLLGIVQVFIRDRSDHR